MTEVTYLGFDVHAATIVIGQLGSDQDKPDVSEIPNDPVVIRRTIKRLKKGRELRCCYEAGPCGYVLFRQLQEFGVACDVIAPSLIPRKPGDRIKTDRRDAAKLARLYRAGELTPIRVPDEDQEAVRDLVRAREDARRERTNARHRLTKFLLRHGLRYPACNWTQGFWSWIGKISFDRDEHGLVLHHYVDSVLQLDRRIQDLDKHIEDVASREPYKSQVEVLSCLRGIRTLAAMIIISEVYDLRRFASPRQFMAFLGIVPSEHSSGQRQRRGGITKTGNGHVRRILVEAAWAYRHRPGITARQRKQLIGQPPAIADICRKADHRLTRRLKRLEARGKRSQVALTAVARELAGFIWAISNERVA